MSCKQRMPRTSILALLLTVSFTYVNAQNVTKPTTAIDLIQQGATLIDSGSYDKAGALFEKVSPNDTNYMAALFEDAVARESNSEDSLTITICDKGLAVESDYLPDFYKLKASALIDLKRYNEAITVIDSAIGRYPNIYLLYFTKGYAYFQAEKYDSAIAEFEHSIQLNTFHTLSHYYLAKCCLAQERIIPALLSLQFCLVLEPNNARSFSIVQLIEKVSENKYDFDASTAVDPDKYGDQPFDDLTLLVKSQVALNKDYKLKTDVNYNVIKQCQLIYDKLKYVPNTSNFWMNTYVKFFVDMRSQGSHSFFAKLFNPKSVKNYFDPYSHYIMQSINDDALQASIKKEKKKIDDFTDWAEKEIVAMRHTRTITIDGKPTTVTCYYYDNHLPQAMGPEDAKGNDIGEWTIYHENNGTVKAKGSFGNDGKRTGTWHWYYNNGRDRETTGYVEGNRSGASETWYENGSIKGKYTYKDDKLDGEVWEYNNSGMITSHGYYKDGTPTGIFTMYYADGRKNFVVNYGPLGLDSVQREFYADGRNELYTMYKDGKKNGLLIEYWPSGKIKDSGEYSDGNATGKWNFYYENGALQKVLTYKDNLPIGTGTIYYPNGKIEEVTPYNDDGQINGTDITYDDDGIKYGELDYKKDALEHFAYYDKAGKILSEGKVSDKKLHHDNYYANGNKHSEGLTVDNKRSGEWKFYATTGALTTTEFYVNGHLNGNDTDFFSNGKIKDITPYINDTLNGEYKEYFINDSLKVHGWYLNGNAEGDWHYYDPRGDLASTCYYVGGQVNGYDLFYDPNGKMTEKDFYYKTGYLDKVWVYDSTGKKIIYTYSSDKGNGHYFSTFPNGQTKTDRTYVAGQNDGHETRYFYSGKVSTQGDYLLDKQEGIYRTYYDNGDSLSVFNYINGELNGPGRTYYRGNKIREAETYLGDALSGKYTEYYSNGAINHEGDFIDSTTRQKYTYYSPDKSLYCVRWYRDNIISAYTYPARDGKLVPVTEIKNGTGKLTSYFANGNKGLECTYYMGDLNGKRVQYFSNGKPMEDENYYYGYYSGLQSYYYPNGNPKSKENYYLGQKNGKCTYYYDNGKIEHDETWVMDNKQGVFNYYDRSGKLIKTAVYYNDDEVYETKK